MQTAPNMKADAVGGKHQPFDESEKAKIAGLVIVFVLILGGIVYILSSIIAGSSAASVQACENKPLLSTQYACINGLANATENLSICGALPQPQSYSCIVNVAMKQQNVSACSLINKSQQIYSQCVVTLSRYTSNYSYCNALPGNSGLQCIANIAYQHSFSDFSGCLGLANSTLASVCTNLHYYGSALIGKQPSYCSSISAKANYQNIYAFTYAAYISNITSLSASGIGLLKANSSLADYCYYALARTENDISICSMSQSNSDAELCESLMENYTSNSI